MPRQFPRPDSPVSPAAFAGAARRFVLFLVGTLVALSVVLTSYFYIQQREYNRFSFQNVVWDGVQFRNEYQVFRAALLENLLDTKGSSAELLQRRYDILFSRLHLMRDGYTANVYRNTPDLIAALHRIEPTVRGWDKLLTAYLAGDRAAGLAIADQVHEVDADFTAFASGVNAIGVQRLEVSRDKLNSLYMVLIGVAIATWLLVIGFAIALMRQLRATERAHAEMQAMTADLEEARREAEEASRAKSNFLAAMSHELRTPLNAVLGFAEIMRQGLFGPVGNPRYAEYVDGIVKSGQHLLSLINDVLDMSRVEAGKVELREVALDIGEAVDEALDLVRVSAEGKSVRLLRSIPAVMPQLRADMRLLRQMLLNLLSNAIKFTPDGGSVEITSEVLVDGSLAVHVRDTGVGMTEYQLKRVFEPFSQGDSLRAREIGGSGLGLPITRRLIELHDGQIHLASRKGAGTTATLIFPAGRVRAMSGTA
ncbi:MAG: ATP-binding protein [Ferrovibrio sp.]